MISITLLGLICLFFVVEILMDFVLCEQTFS